MMKINDTTMSKRANGMINTFIEKLVRADYYLNDGTYTVAPYVNSINTTYKVFIRMLCSMREYNVLTEKDFEKLCEHADKELLDRNIDPRTAILSN